MKKRNIKVFTSAWLDSVLYYSHLSHYTAAPGWRMELISAGLNACLFHLGVTLRCTEGGRAGGMKDWHSLLWGAKLYREWVRRQNVKRDRGQGEKIILSEEWCAKEVRRKKENKGQEKWIWADLNSLGWRGDEELNERPRNVHMWAHIFKPAIKSVDVHQSGHLSSSHTAPSASGC